MQGPLCHRTIKNTLHYETQCRVKDKEWGGGEGGRGGWRGGEATEVAAVK